MALIRGWQYLLLGICLSPWPSVVAQERLAPAELADAIAMGRACQAAIARVTSADGDFTVFLESPQARASIVTATAVMMQQPLDSAHVRAAMQPGYRVWVQRKRNDWRPLTLIGLTVRSGSRTLRPTSTRSGRFVVGTVASHGIIEELRTRFPEFVFDALPAGDLEVLVEASTGTQRYRVPAQTRGQPIRICN